MALAALVRNAQIGTTRLAARGMFADEAHFGQRSLLLESLLLESSLLESVLLESVLLESVLLESLLLDLLLLESLLLESLLLESLLLKPLILELRYPESCNQSQNRATTGQLRTRPPATSEGRRLGAKSPRARDGRRLRQRTKIQFIHSRSKLR